MNIFDIIVLAIISLTTLLGLWKGLIKQLFALAGVIVGYLIAIKMYEPVSQQFPNLDPGVSKIISCLAIFVVCIVIASIIGRIAGRILRIAGLSWANRIGGGALGFLKGFLVIAVAALILITFLPTDSSLTKNSLTLPYVNMGIRAIRSVIPEGLWTQYEKKLEDARLRRLKKDMKKTITP